jgi:glycosyltransferase involved in cell wall biosynthesis
LPVAHSAEARRLLGLPQEGFLVSCFGLVTRAKRIDQAIKAFRLLSRHRPEARFLIVGEVQKGYSIEELEASPDLRNKVILTGHQPIDRFYLYMLASDVVVNLRFPSTGELSGTLIRALGMGKPVLVSNTGPFVEFPEHTVARIDLGPPEVKEIAATLELLASRPDLREAIGRFAREHVEETYSLRAEAAAYIEFLHRVLEGLRQGKLTPPPPYDQADLAAAIMATLSDLPLGSTFGLETVREALRSATDRAATKRSDGCATES